MQPEHYYFSDIHEFFTRYRKQYDQDVSDEVPEAKAIAKFAKKWKDESPRQIDKLGKLTKAYIKHRRQVTGAWPTEAPLSLRED